MSTQHEYGFHGGMDTSGFGREVRDVQLSETAHDLANLLQILGSSLNLMKREIDQPDSVRARLASAMVGVTLCMSLSRTMFSAAPAPVEGRVRLQSVIDSGRPLFELAAGPDVEVEILCPLTPLWVEVDKSRLERALLNLVVNAAQAVSGRGLIRIECRVEAGRILLSVEDDGPGFTPLSAACGLDRRFTTKPQGSGLGLTSVNSLMTSVGGRVVLSRSELGGAFVGLVFPRPANAGARAMD